MEAAAWISHSLRYLSSPAQRDRIPRVTAAEGEPEEGRYCAKTEKQKNRAGKDYLENHTCLIYGDCLILSYKCAPDAFCDQISIEAITTKHFTDPPGDPEGEWPPGCPQKIPVLRILRLADRFGMFE